MIRLFVIFALTAGLTGCIIAPPYGYGYAPGYYAVPAIDLGFGFGGHDGGHGGHER